MKRNEKIAEIMGFKLQHGLTSDGLNWDFYQVGPNHQMGIGKFNPKIDTDSAELLENKMVADGWEIRMVHRICGSYFFEAINDRDMNYFNTEKNTKPAALHALFCKVFNIGGEG